jgi:fatty-acyl-CoA synthase
MPINADEAVRFWARARPADLAFVQGDRSLTWAELDRRATEYAVGLRAAGLRRGDVLSVLMDGSLEYVAIFAGAVKLGAITAGLSPRLAQAEVAHQINEVGSTIVITSPEHEYLVAGVAADPQITVYSLGGRDYPQASQLRGKGEVEPSGSEPRDGLVICFTSGTTGHPKGALLTHYSAREVAIINQVQMGFTWRDRVLAPQPFYIAGGLCGAVAQFGFFSGCTVYIESSFDPGQCLRMIEELHIGLIALAPVFLERMAAHPDFDKADLSSLVDITTGGAMISTDLVETYLRKNVNLVQGYGMTESSVYVTKLPAQNAVEHPGTAGSPLMHVHVRIADDEDNDVPVGSAGEILVKSPGIMAGYWGRPEETAQALRGGWLHTGDIGSVDEGGYLTVLDRKKDMFISGGLNVYPAEIERVLSGLPGLSDFVVIGIPDPKWGEAGLIVSGGSGTPVDMTSLRERLEASLARYKWPRFLIERAEPLPRNPQLKVSKLALRGQYGSGDHPGIRAIPRR